MVLNRPKPICFGVTEMRLNCGLSKVLKKIWDLIEG